MDSLKRATISLNLFDDDLDPHEITMLLGAEPDIGVRKGEMYLGYGDKQKEAKTGR